MNDIYDEIERVGNEGAHGMGERLRSASVADALVEASRKGRRRRAMAQGSVASVAAVGLGVGAWAVVPTLNDDAVDPAFEGFGDPRVGEMYTVPTDLGLPWCGTGDEREPLQAYVPVAEPGVTVVDESYADLGVEIEAVLTSVKWFADEPFTPLYAGEVADFPEAMTEGGGEPGVQFYVSWEGDELLTVEATALLVGDGWVVSYPHIEHTDRLSGGANPLTQVLPVYDEATDTSSKATFTWLNTDCLTYPNRGNRDHAFLVPDSGPMELHTVVQLIDTDGNAVLTAVDATGIEHTAIRFSGAEADGAFKTLPAVTEADLELAVERFAQAASRAHQPAAASVETIRALLESDGQQLATATVGHRSLTDCSTQVELVRSAGVGLQVVTGDADAPRIPREWPWDQLLADGEEGMVPFTDADQDGYSIDEWYTGLPLMIVLTDVNDQSAVRGVVTGRMAWAVPNEEPIMVFAEEQGCDDVTGIVPGDYHAVVVAPGAPFLFTQNVLGVNHDVAETWIDYGLITITE